MRLNFGKLAICNFKSFSEDEFDFSSSFGMTLVCGRNLDIPGQANSAGKSSIFDALLFALFGQLQTKVKNSSLKNRYIDDREMFVSLNFNVDDSKFYRIQRGLDNHGKSYLHLYEIENGVEKDITKSSISETEEFLENELLNCDISIFLRTIMLSADNNYNFFLLSLSEKKNFIEKLFNIRVFGEMYKLIHRDVLDFDKKFSIKQNELILLSKNSDEYSSKIKEFDINRDNKLYNINKEIEELSSKLNELRKNNIEVNSTEISKLEDLINKLESKKIEIKNKKREKQTEHNDLDRKRIKLSSTKDQNEKTISSYSSLLSKLCEKCLPIVSDYYNLTDLKNKNESIEIELAKLNESISSIESMYAKIDDKIVKIDEKISEVNGKINDLTHDANELKNAEIKIESELSYKQKEKSKLENEENPYKDLYDKNEIKMRDLNVLIEKLNIDYNYLKLAEAIVSQDTIKKFIIKDLIILLNSKIKYYLMKLGAKYTCVFNEDMDFTFITPDDGGETEYATFSAGERMRLSIATSFAFRDFMSSRNNFTANVLILDEFIDSAIDSLAVNNVLQILKEFSRMNRQHVLIISHRKEIDNSIFDNIVMVEKQNNISSIKYLPPEK